MTEPEDSGLTAHNDFDDEDVAIPQHVVDCTEAMLSMHPPTNQRVVLDTAQWWVEHVGNCPIYRWCVNHLDSLENAVKEDATAFREAVEQAETIGMEV